MARARGCSASVYWARHMRQHKPISVLPIQWATGGPMEYDAIENQCVLLLEVLRG